MVKIYAVLLLLFICAVTSASACVARVGDNETASGSQRVSQQTDIAGRITSVNRASAQSGNKNLIGSIFVEDERKKGTPLDKASVSVTTETRLSKEEGGTRREAAFDDLQIGVEVRVTFTGAALMSYPVRATAGEIVIIVKDRERGSSEADLNTSPQSNADLPSAARAALDAGFLEWRIADVSDNVKQFFASGSQDAPPQVFTGDFDGNGQTDYAVNLWRAADRRQTIAVLLNNQMGNAFTVRKLETVPFNPNQEGTGLYLTHKRKGDLIYDYEAKRRVELGNDAVAVNNFEKSSWIYVYQAGDFRKVFTAD